jgi:hypothetical protein
MQIEYVKNAVAVSWGVTVAMAGYAGGITSPAGWTVLMVLAAAPPLVMLRLWRPPVESMSQSIRKALR